MRENERAPVKRVPVKLGAPFVALAWGPPVAWSGCVPWPWFAWSGRRVLGRSRIMIVTPPPFRIGSLSAKLCFIAHVCTPYTP